MLFSDNQASLEERTSGGGVAGLRAACCQLAARVDTAAASLPVSDPAQRDFPDTFPREQCFFRHVNKCFECFNAYTEYFVLSSL